MHPNRRSFLGLVATAVERLSDDMEVFAARINAMLARRRKDPAVWQALPFSVYYQEKMSRRA